MRKRILIAMLVIFTISFVLPEWPRVPVTGASARDWNAASFWYEPWGASGVHKGIDIFAAKGAAVVAPTYGVVIFRGEVALGGRVVAVLSPKWRIHYFAHLGSAAVYPGYPVWNGRILGTVGDSGNAKGKPPHLHYSIVTLVPYPWRVDATTQGWKKMFYLDPSEVLGKSGG
ncbi:MAG: M23 family metallopeptidase [Methylobacillus sp.]|jgi:murein DD-endopeptidase MepM/ murein hydrolase activator NlpD|nr:M23 family metallopeptidase [Methylobacillus sp.]